MGTAWTYAGDIYEEHVAIRTKAGLMDVSGLKKVHLVGPHAIAVLEYITTRDMTRIYPGRSVYACMLNDRGHFTEDCIVYRTGPNAWMLVHGSGSGYEEVLKQAQGRNCAVQFDDDLHDLSLQGPLAVDYLARHVPGIRDLRYFHHMQTTLFGAPVMISRTGYTGERGYELFVRGQDAPLIWDAILSEGRASASSPAASAFSTCSGSRATCSSSLRQLADVPLRERAAGRFAVGARSRVHGEPWKVGFRGAEEHLRLKARNASRSSGCSSMPMGLPMPATPSWRAIGRWASSRARVIRSSPASRWRSCASAWSTQSRARSFG
jgi:aminomethyltransferase